MIEPVSQRGASGQRRGEERRNSATEQHAIGIDAGGTKIAAGLVRLPEGMILARRLQPTAPTRGGATVLDDVASMALSLIEEGKTMGACPSFIGIGVCELVSPADEILSEATIHWKGQPIAAQVCDKTQLPVCVDADVRVAARGEAHLGAGRGLSSFLYVTVGTGISASFVLNGTPYAGPRRTDGNFRQQRGLDSHERRSLGFGAAAGAIRRRPRHRCAVRSATAQLQRRCHRCPRPCGAGKFAGANHCRNRGASSGAAIAQLVNVLDPQEVVLGGGLGLATGLYRDSLEQAFKQHVWADQHRGIPIFSAHLRTDAGVIGAALGAVALKRLIDTD